MMKESHDIKEIWKNAAPVPDELVREEIDTFRNKKRNSIYSSLESVILMQIVQKIIYGLALIAGFILFKEVNNITLTLIILFLITTLLTFIDFRTLQKIRIIKQAGQSIAEALTKLERFLNKDFYLYRFYASFSNPILIITGILYYFYYKYGHFATFTEPDSIVVFLTIIVLSWLIAYIGMIFSTRKIVQEIASYTEIIDNSEDYKNIIQKDKRQRRIRIIQMLAILVSGILIFLLLLLR
jgi:uncharacterized membrane protein